MDLNLRRTKSPAKEEARPAARATRGRRGGSKTKSREAAPGEEGLQQEGRSLGKRGRAAMAGLRERVPSGRQLVSGANEARRWATDQVGAHPVAVGLSALTAGMMMAVALVPTAGGEKGGFARVSARGRSLGRVLTGGRLGASHAGAQPEGAKALPAPAEKEGAARAAGRARPAKKAAARGAAGRGKTSHTRARPQAGKSRGSASSRSRGKQGAAEEGPSAEE